MTQNSTPAPAALTIDQLRAHALDAITTDAVRQAEAMHADMVTSNTHRGVERQQAVARVLTALLTEDGGRQLDLWDTADELDEAIARAARTVRAQVVDWILTGQR